MLVPMPPLGIAGEHVVMQPLNRSILPTAYNEPPQNTEQSKLCKTTHHKTRSHHGAGSGGATTGCTLRPTQRKGAQRVTQAAADRATDPHHISARCDVAWQWEMPFEGAACPLARLHQNEVPKRRQSAENQGHMTLKLPLFPPLKGVQASK